MAVLAAAAKLKFKYGFTKASQDVLKALVTSLEQEDSSKKVGGLFLIFKVKETWKARNSQDGKDKQCKLQFTVDSLTHLEVTGMVEQGATLALLVSKALVEALKSEGGAPDGRAAQG